MRTQPKFTYCLLPVAENLKQGLDILTDIVFNSTHDKTVELENPLSVKKLKCMKILQMKIWMFLMRSYLIMRIWGDPF